MLVETNGLSTPFVLTLSKHRQAKSWFGEGGGRVLSFDKLRTNGVVGRRAGLGETNGVEGDERIINPVRAEFIEAQAGEESVRGGWWARPVPDHGEFIEPQAQDERGCGEANGA